MACSLIAIITNHSCGKLLAVQFEFIGACFPLVDISIDHVALGESYASLGIDEHHRVRPATARGTRLHLGCIINLPACHPSFPRVLTLFFFFPEHIIITWARQKSPWQVQTGVFSRFFCHCTALIPCWTCSSWHTNLLIAEYGKSFNSVQSAPFRKK